MNFIFFMFSFINFVFIIEFTDSVVGTGTITSPWTSVSAGPSGPLGPADANGPGVDGKHLDVGDLSDVSFFFLFEFQILFIELLNVIMCYLNFRMTKICHQLMPKVFGVPILNKVFKKLWPYTHHADEEKLYSLMRVKCMVSNHSFMYSIYVL